MPTDVGGDPYDTIEERAAQLLIFLVVQKRDHVRQEHIIGYKKNIILHIISAYEVKVETSGTQNVIPAKI